ncbi:MAG: anaerobic carbon-monoxide dehydrogenase catalytic subunit [candidate division WS1 bacterium]|jgi:carbon-monoxide dehydrogenase catalytic subunit|nr:anaerobic carbon-monoxide dehydrogenase catalytic subunit [candidate division WS1 bacterium]
MPETISQHETVNAQHQVMAADGATNVADRYDAQGNRCPFCEQGLRCSLCSQGPCRITAKAPRGVCGIDAAGMVMRNMMHLNQMGLGAYAHHTTEVAKTLIATGEGKTPFGIADESKLNMLAAVLDIDEPDVNARAVAVGKGILASMAQPFEEESIWVRKLAPESRQQLWRELGIFPGGPLFVLQDAVARGMTNIDGDYISLAKTSLRMGIATFYGVQVPLEMGQDAIFGTPTPHTAHVDLGILDPDYVNIVPNGHEPFIGFALVQAAESEEVQQRAKDAGAKGLRIVGSIETGQEMMQRLSESEVFVGLTGNWICEEYAIATGAIDVFAMDMNCSVPSLGEIADRYNTKLVAVSELIGVPGTHERVDYVPEQAAEQAQQIIDIGIANFIERKGKETNPVERRQEIMTGFSTEAVLTALGGTLEPLLDAVKGGAIRGIVAMVSCTTLKNGPQDSLTVSVVKELIKRNILVLSAGCGNAATQVAGLNSIEAQSLAGEGLRGVCEALGVPPVLSFGTCTDCGRIALLVGAVADALGVDPSQLPIAVTAPEYMEQKATIDALGALALGLYTHVSPTPPVGGSPEVVKLLTEDLEGITGGKVALGDDPVAVAEDIAAHIDKKRAALGI